MKIFTIVFQEMTTVTQKHNTMKKVRARTRTVQNSSY